MDAKRRFAAGAISLLTLAFHGWASGEETSWPRTIERPGGKIVVYQPQFESFKGNRIAGRAAVSVKIAGHDELHFGAIWIAAQVSTDRADRTVDLHGAKVTDIKFPEATDAQRERLRAAIDEVTGNWDLSMSLDQFMTALQLAEKEKAAAEEYNNAPPKLVISKTPAVLVTIAGEPKLKKIDKTRLLRVINSQFLIVLDPDAKAYYLSAGENWMTAEQVQGPWRLTDRVPGAALALEAGKDPADLAGMSLAPEPAADEVVPSIIVATEPTELIVLDGEPEFQTVPDTNLLYVSNTESDTFVSPKTRENLFADRDGSVYRKGLNGWERPAGGISPAGRDPQAGRPLDNQRIRELDNAMRTRTRGDERTRQFTSRAPTPRAPVHPVGRPGGGFRGRR